MPRLAAMTVSDLMNLRGKIRGLFEPDEPPTFEDAAQRVVDLYTMLPDDLKRFALSREPAAESLPELRCPS